jgi:NADH-quinone oxidoreductase subunit L
MSDLQPIVWLIPGLPLAAAFVTAFIGPKFLGKHSHWPCILASVGACVCAFIVLFAVVEAARKAEEPAKAGEQATQVVTTQVVNYGSWIEVGRPADVILDGRIPLSARRGVEVNLNFRVDPLSAAMLAMITFVSSLIVIFAVGYMHGDGGYPRFFAAVSLFIFSMTLLVLADNLILLYAGWEGVGLCSYLLIGFWFNKPSAAAAARKAFLVTRIGDVGLMLGILLLWYSFGFHLDYDSLFATVQRQHANGTLDTTTITTACLLLFCGAAGKSAQFPLHVWLPDAMEGPTPVSALIHAATMVTAGVYLVARCSPLFALAPDAQLVVATLGGITMLGAALIGLTQTDLKRVLAYSTLSQLGYMFLALGCALNDESLVRFAVGAAIFHLLTHAFFKALLFLSAGSVMHAMGNVIDMRRFSGLRKVLPHTHWTFLVGALALSGFPGLSGFWSKDEILDAAYQAGRHPGNGGAYFLLFLAGMLTAFLTAFYTFRAYFLTFWGELKVPPEAGSHGHADHAAAGGHGHGHAPAAHAGGGVAHESPPVMTVPLMVLAIFAAGIGAALGPTHLFEHLFETATIFEGLNKNPGVGEMNVELMTVSSLLALGGIGLAWLMYVRQTDLPGKVARSAGILYQLSYNKFYVDELYGALIVAPLQGFNTFARIFDLNVLDSIVDLIGHVPVLVGKLFRPVQNGLVQFYALAMVLGLTVFLLALVRSLQG